MSGEVQVLFEHPKLRVDRIWHNPRRAEHESHGWWTVDKFCDENGALRRTLRRMEAT